MAENDKDAHFPNSIHDIQDLDQDAYLGELVRNAEAYEAGGEKSQTNEQTPRNTQEPRSVKRAEITRNSAAVAFNKTAVSLLSSLLTFWPNDNVMQMMLSALSKQKEHIEVPALLFMQECSPIVTLDNGQKVGIFDLIIRRDEVLVTDHCSSVQILHMLKIKERYPLLSETNRAYVWNTLIQLLRYASMVYAFNNDGGKKIEKMMDAVQARATKLNAGKRKYSPQELAKLIGEDNQVKDAAKAFAIEALQHDGVKVSDKAIEEVSEQIINSGKNAVNQANLMGGVGDDQKRAQRVTDRLRKKIATKQTVKQSSPKQSSPKQSSSKVSSSNTSTCTEKKSTGPRVTFGEDVKTTELTDEKKPTTGDV